ncbi:trypsin 3A1-like [Toxorhynchites rutilus septentrionalis]|uniref:trypsin 3A1-like n=1 Tax=Toxorhynchites rutilus septentrionalis TaxID=329112 RepID=UPI0024793DE2|nr:trypsin 3A1-like [Toxorhynchites rutilus septentrionalis]
MIIGVALICWIQLTGTGGSILPKTKPGMSGSRIVGGIPVNITAYPYQVSLQRGRHFCGGSVVNERWILTAAHCTKGITDPITLKVRAGSTEVQMGGVLAQVQNIYFHPKQNSWNDYDFSLLELKESLQLSDHIKPIPLPSEGDTFADGTICVVSGWGNTHNENESSLSLRAASVPLYNQEMCSSVYKDYGGVTKSMICAGFEEGGKDSCQGDSGGPLACDGVLVGVVSWGKGCAVAGYPGVYGRVTSAVNWIAETMNEVVHRDV